MITRRSGHRLETESTRPGLFIASCSCGHVYSPPSGRGQVFQTWQRDALRRMHAEHVETLP